MHPSVRSQSPVAQLALLGVKVHCPPEQPSTVHATLSLHSEALQHARQPTPAQQCVPAAHPESWHLPEMQVLVVHGSPSSQPWSFEHSTVGMQPAVGLHV
jgi:hypothetical protein